ncbi:MAG: alpha/beta hydrolase [Clostridia bacterium]|nr:alpha/beta hydrolase [Clostridia bacterium]
MQEFFYENKGTKIFCTAWEDADAPRGVVVLVHDAGDYGKRLADYADFLNANGYLVLAPDLRGHGRTAGGYDKRGEVVGDSFFDTVDDLHQLVSFALSSYRLPLVMVGMGYGAVITLAFTEQYGDSVMGAVLLSPNAFDGAKAFVGNVVSSTLIGFIDSRNPATIINKYRYKRYEKPFLSEKNRYAWISRDKNEVKNYVNDAYCGAQFSFSLGFEQSFYRGATKTSFAKRMRAIPADLPILLLGGDGDPVCEYGLGLKKLHAHLQKAGKKKCVMRVYRHARHDLLRETNRDEVYMDTLTFINLCFGK